MMHSGSPPRVVYVIPAFNEGEVIAAVIRSLQAQGVPGTIIVVDDASGDGTGEAARSAGAIVLQHLINRGQGAALQTGFDAALRLGADVVITFDADGQHSPGDTHLMLDALTTGGADVVLASRFLSDTNEMPRGRKVVLRLGLLFTRLVSGIRVTDTHNGLRAFRAEVLRRIRVTEDRMAHASELLDAIAKAGFRYSEIPCNIRYTRYSLQKGQRWYAAVPIAFDFLFGKVMR